MGVRKVLCALLALAVCAVVPAQCRVLYIGDSITDGNWGTNCNGERNLWDQNHIFGHGYMYLCASQYMGRYPSGGLEFYNRGISGNTIYDLEKRWKKDALDIGPDVLSVLVGINDVILSKDGLVDTVAWEAKYRELLDLSVARNPDLLIVIGEPFCETGFRLDGEGRMESACHALSRACWRIAKDYSAVFLPYQKMFDELCSQNGVPYWIWDGVHPTPAGHYRMAQMWMERVNAYLCNDGLKR